jgi:hypothetical protein
MEFSRVDTVECTDRRFRTQWNFTTDAATVQRLDLDQA